MSEVRWDARAHAIWGGLGVSSLFAVGNAIWAIGMPSAGAPVPQILDFYEERSLRIVVGGSISLLALAALIWFAAATRQVLSEAGAPDFLTMAAFGGAVVTTVIGSGAESLNIVAALRAREGELSPDLGRVLFEVTQDFGSVQSGLGLALFSVAVGVAGLRSGALARWRCALLLVAGVMLLTPLARYNVVPGVLLIVVASTVAVGLMRTSWNSLPDRGHVS